MLDPNPDNRPSAKECLDDPVFKHHKPEGQVEINKGGMSNLQIDTGYFILKLIEIEIII